MAIRRYFSLLGAGMSLLSAQAAYAFAPTYTAPANKVGAAMAEGITQTLIRRGFSAGDPRIAQTIAAVGSRVAPLATSAGAGASWIGVASRLSPWVTAGVVVYTGITWYNDLQGKVYLAPPGSTSTAPVFSNGITQGQPCWGVGTDCFGSPQEALSYLFSQTQAQYPKASYGVPSLTQDSASQYTAQYNYSIPELYLANFSGTKVITRRTAGTTCPAGSGMSGTGSTPTGCISAGLAASPFAGAPLASYTPQQAYDNLPPEAKTAPLSPPLAAETTNRFWKDASAQPDYPGVPWSSAAPVSPPDFAPYQNAHPEAWPPTSDLAQPIPTTGPSPITSPDGNADQTTSPSTSTKVDLGPDPGVQAPTLEDTPKDLFKPISDLLQPWLTWTVPAHSAQCPTWQASPSIAGHVFSIDLSYHCTLAEQYRSAITTAAMVCWLLIAAFIVLSA